MRIGAERARCAPHCNACRRNSIAARPPPAADPRTRTIIARRVRVSEATSRARAWHRDTPRRDRDGPLFAHAGSVAAPSPVSRNAWQRQPAEIDFLAIARAARIGHPCGAAIAHERIRCVPRVFDRRCAYVRKCEGRNRCCGGARQHASVGRYRGARAGPNRACTVSGALRNNRGARR